MPNQSKYVDMLIPERLRKPGEFPIVRIRVLEETSDMYLLEKDLSGWPTQNAFWVLKEHPGIVAVLENI